MRPVRFVALSEDGQALILTDEVGRMLSLAIDEQVTAAVQRERTGAPGQLAMDVEATLTPRDIQARIRSGESAENVARMAHVSMEKVLRFAGPVLQERAAMAQLARRTRLRGADSGQTLAEVVDGRLRSHGVDVETVAWDSYRRDDGSWRTIANWPSGKATAQAIWDLDRSRSMVTPVDDMARFLSAERQDLLIGPEDGLVDGSPTRAHLAARYAEDADPKEGPAVPALSMLRRRDDRQRTETPRPTAASEERRFDDLRPPAPRPESAPRPVAAAAAVEQQQPDHDGAAAGREAAGREAGGGGWRDPWREQRRDEGRRSASWLDEPGTVHPRREPVPPANPAVPPAADPPAARTDRDAVAKAPPAGPARRDDWRERLDPTGVGAAPAASASTGTSGGGGGRGPRSRKAELPSWDDILFGSRRSN